MGLGMHHVAALRATATRSPQHQPSKSVIFINAVGGMSQLETFDMKPEGPAKIRGEFRPISTTAPDIEICEHLPMLAQRAHLFSLVRSLSHPYTGHQQGLMVIQSGRTPLPQPFSGRRLPTDWPAMGSLVKYATQPRNNMPQAVILPELLHLHPEGIVSGQTGGIMGSQYDPWVIVASHSTYEEWGACPDCFGWPWKPDYKCRAKQIFETPRLELPQSVDDRRLSHRFDLLREIDRQRGHLEQAASTRSFDRYRQQAVSLLTDGRVRDAFDVRNADPVVQDRYGRNKFGWSLLMARRLVEVGVNMVHVNLGHGGTWDTHEQQFPKLKERLFPPSDRAISALLDDLKQSGLLEDVLVVLASEFGRTPRIYTPKGNRSGLPGRGHWPFVQTVLFAGGGVQGGRVVGKTDKQSAYPTADKKTPEDFAATIYHTLGIPKTAVWYDATDRPNHIYHGEPITELL
jgi:hypothetical protein